MPNPWSSIRRCVVVIWSLVWLTGCVYPVTEGFHKQLPAEGARTIVWGENPPAVETVSLWLQRRGLAVLDGDRVRQALNEQHIRLTGTSLDDLQLLALGRSLRADVAVMVRAEAGARFSSASELLRTVVYLPRVTVRGLDVANGQELWRGTAQYPEPVKNLEESLTRLACQAMATAWGFRPPGVERIPSADMCAVAASKAPP
ncbi:hypothetical protein [Nitrospira sp. Kam-Ns4a]